MDWFEQITGFREQDYDATRRRLSVVDGHLHSTHSVRVCAVGRLETPSLAELRQCSIGLASGLGPTRVECVHGDVRRLHADAGNAGAMFQVASQFNLLEMVGPDDTPEQGVTRYQDDPTQGPACAIAASAATIFRNYFAPVDGGQGQRGRRQIDCLRDLGEALANGDGGRWTMRNGYCMITDQGLAGIDDLLASLGPAQLDDLRGRLRIGVHAQVEVTDDDAGHRVTQAFCSALPVADHRVATRSRWRRFAVLVLEAAYEATLLAAALDRSRRDRPRVYLTRLGGGAFGNDPAWIAAAMARAIETCRNAALDIRIVSLAAPPTELTQLAARFAPGRT